MNIAQYLGFINTPALWKDSLYDVQQFEFPHVTFANFAPSPIPDNLRLGHRIEYIFKQLIEHNHTYEIILYNLQIGHRERTLGEIDYILKDPLNHKYIHVELTYKFYLIDDKITLPIHKLIGPNRRDAFYMKMEKIKQIQYPLLHSTLGIQALADYHIDHQEISHQCCFKAQLFRPYNSVDTDIGALNKACIVGYWLRLADLSAPDFAQAKFYIPAKSAWIVEPHEQVPWISLEDIIADIQLRLDKENAPLIWSKKTTGDYEKIFVVWW